MKQLFTFLLLLVCANAFAGAGSPRANMSLETNAVIAWPTNFFVANSNRLNAAVRHPEGLLESTEVILSVARGGRLSNFVAAADTDTYRGLKLLTQANKHTNDFITVFPGTFLIPTNVTIANNIRFQPGAAIQPASGVTVTFTGSVDANFNRVICDTSAGGRFVFNTPERTVRMGWFVTDSNTDDVSTIHDSTDAMQASVDATPNRGKLIVPPFVLNTRLLSISNRIGLTISGETKVLSAGLAGYGGRPWIGWIGSSNNIGTNRVLMDISDSTGITVENLTLTTDTAAADPTNRGNIAILFRNPVDLPGQYTPTASRFENLWIQDRSSSTNRQWRGIVFGREGSDNNNEFNTIANCQFVGGTDDTNTENEGTGIEIGMSQSFNNRIENCTFNACRTYVYVRSGNFTMDGTGGSRGYRSFDFAGQNGPVAIRHFRDELPTHFLWTQDSVSSRVLLEDVQVSEPLDVPIVFTRFIPLEIHGSSFSGFTTNTFLGISNQNNATLIMSSSVVDGGVLNTNVFDGGAQFNSVTTIFETFDAHREGTNYIREIGSKAATVSEVFRIGNVAGTTNGFHGLMQEWGLLGDYTGYLGMWTTNLGQPARVSFENGGILQFRNSARTTLHRITAAPEVIDGSLSPGLAIMGDDSMGHSLWFPRWQSINFSTNTVQLGTSNYLASAYGVAATVSNQFATLAQVQGATNTFPAALTNNETRAVTLMNSITATQFVASATGSSNSPAFGYDSGATAMGMNFDANRLSLLINGTNDAFGIQMTNDAGQLKVGIGTQPSSSAYTLRTAGSILAGSAILASAAVTSSSAAPKFTLTDTTPGHDDWEVSEDADVLSIVNTTSNEVAVAFAANGAATFSKSVTGSNGFSSDGITFFKIPTNAPTAGVSNVVVVTGDNNKFVPLSGSDPNALTNGETRSPITFQSATLQLAPETWFSNAVHFLATAYFNIFNVTTLNVTNLNLFGPVNGGQQTVTNLDSMQVSGTTYLSYLMVTNGSAHTGSNWFNGEVNVVGGSVRGAFKSVDNTTGATGTVGDWEYKNGIVTTIGTIPGSTPGILTNNHSVPVTFNAGLTIRGTNHIGTFFITTNATGRLSFESESWESDGAPMTLAADGILNATGFSGNAASLTNMPGSSLQAGGAFPVISGQNLTNLVLNIQTNSFSGPTNTIALGADATYTALGNCSITGFSGVILNQAQYAALAIYNSSGSNTTLTIPSTWLTPDGLRSYTLTNGIVTQVSLRRTTAFTNASVVPFY